jgi:Flp pilus assembly protein CpaB
MSKILRHARRSLSRPLRRPTVHLAASAALVVVTTMIVWNLVSAASEGARRYGEPRTVLVAVADLRPGDRIDPTNAELAQLPLSAVPPGAVRSMRPTTLTEAVFKGQVLVAGDLSIRRSPSAAGLAAGRRAIGLSRDRAGLALARGDVVDVLAPDDDGSMSTVAEAATVLATDVNRVTISIDADETSAVATAITADVAIVVLRPG